MINSGSFYLLRDLYENIPLKLYYILYKLNYLFPVHIIVFSRKISRSK